MTDPFAPLARGLANRAVRYLLIGVSGANFYAPPAGSHFVTDDYDLFLPLDPENLVQAWAACDDLRLSCGLQMNRSIARVITGSLSGSSSAALLHV